MITSSPSCGITTSGYTFSKPFSDTSPYLSVKLRTEDMSPNASAESLPRWRSVSKTLLGSEESSAESLEETSFFFNLLLNETTSGNDCLKLSSDLSYRKE